MRVASRVRVLDEVTRQRRHKRQLEALEKDNFQEDPHAAFAHIVIKNKLPAFSDNSEGIIGSASLRPLWKRDSGLAMRDYVGDLRFALFCREGAKEETKNKSKCRSF